MANSESAKKAIRRIERRTEVNRQRRSRMRTFLRAVEDAITAGDQDKARKALTLAEPEIARAVRKGVLHRNTGARKVSRLTKRIKSMSAAGE